MWFFLNVHIFSSFNDNLNIFFCYAYLTGMYCLIENMPLYFTITSSIVWFLFGLYFKNLNMPFIDCATVSLLFIRRNCSNLENRFFFVMTLQMPAFQRNGPRFQYNRKQTNCIKTIKILIPTKAPTSSAVV